MGCRYKNTIVLVHDSNSSVQDSRGSLKDLNVDNISLLHRRIRFDNWDVSI